MKFVASSPGIITGMRYYKSAQDIGTHTGSLWTSTGTLLATATFTNESASGWQTVTFTQPIAVSAGTTYVASYHSNGNYGVTPNFFASNHTNGPLMAPAAAAATASSPRVEHAVPDLHLQCDQLLGGRPLRAGERQSSSDGGRRSWLLRVLQHGARASGEHLARQ